MPLHGEAQPFFMTFNLQVFNCSFHLASALARHLV
jgi:hypothetical protein